MKSVLHNFLGTFTSRYSDYRGFWLLGQLPSDLQEWTWDLFETGLQSDALLDVAGRLAVCRFAEQVDKSRLTINSVREATLQLERGAEQFEGWQGDFRTKGHLVRFFARAVMDNGRVYENEYTVFVAPHNAAYERRRLKEDWGTYIPHV